MTRDTWIVLGIIVAVIGVITLFFAIRLVMKLVAARRMLGELGAGGKLAFWGAMAYTIFPIDLLPDPIYLDDMAVLGSALFYLNKLARRQATLRDGLPHARKVAQAHDRYRRR